jgi:multidrug efflux system membrane fusion protein
MIPGLRIWLAAVCLLTAAAVQAEKTLSGVVGWSQRVELGTLVSGVIREVRVRPGQVVSAGDLLVQLDDRGLRSQLRRTEAEYRHARALLDEAEREDERAAELYDRTVLSDFERNQAAIALEAARARLAQADASRVAARLDLERSTVAAPFDGVVLAVDAAPGQHVVSGLQVLPLVTLGGNRPLVVRAQVDAALAAELAVGQAARVAFRGDEVGGVVSHVGLEPLPASDGAVRYSLWVEVTDTTGLRVGDTVDVVLE